VGLFIKQVINKINKNKKLEIMSENKQTHMKIPYIQAGGDCLGTGWGCDKCYNADGSCACAEGTQPWGCGAGQTPICKSIDEIKIEREAAA